MVHAGSGTGDLISVPDDPAASRSGSKRVYGDYPFSAYVDFLGTSITERSFENREDRGHHHLCLYGGRYPDGVFHQPL